MYCIALYRIFNVLLTYFVAGSEVPATRDLVPTQQPTNLHVNYYQSLLIQLTSSYSIDGKPSRLRFDQIAQYSRAGNECLKLNWTPFPGPNFQIIYHHSHLTHLNSWRRHVTKQSLDVNQFNPPVASVMGYAWFPIHTKIRIQGLARLHRGLQGLHKGWHVEKSNSQLSVSCSHRPHAL